MNYRNDPWKYSLRLIFLKCKFCGFWYTHMYVCHWYPISEHFSSSLKEILYPYTSHFPFPSPSSHWFFLSLLICLLWTFHVNGIIWYMAFCVCLTAWHIRFIHFVAFISFCGQVIFYCIYVPQLFYPLSIDGHLGGIHILPIVNNAAMNIGVHIFFWISFRFLCVYNQKWNCWVLKQFHF